MKIVGEYRHGVDDKGRVTLPSRMRSFLGQEFIQKLAPHGCCFWLFPYATWEHLASRFQPEDLMDLENLDLMQEFAEGASNSSLDKQNRFTIPQNIREGLSVKGEVVLHGLLWVVEVWSVEVWESRTPESKDKTRRATSEFFRQARRTPQSAAISVPGPLAGAGAGAGEDA